MNSNAVRTLATLWPTRHMPMKHQTNYTGYSRNRRKSYELTPRKKCVHTHPEPTAQKRYVV
eukprot:scaffold81952_cov61-Phaeocystis_antarctica.AAC.10